MVWRCLSAHSARSNPVNVHALQVQTRRCTRNHTRAQAHAQPHARTHAHTLRQAHAHPVARPRRSRRQPFRGAQEEVALPRRRQEKVGPCGCRRGRSPGSPPPGRRTGGLVEQCLAAHWHITSDSRPKPACLNHDDGATGPGTGSPTGTNCRPQARAGPGSRPGRRRRHPPSVLAHGLRRRPHGRPVPQKKRRN